MKELRLRAEVDLDTDEANAIERVVVHMPSGGVWAFDPHHPEASSCSCALCRWGMGHGLLVTAKAFEVNADGSVRVELR